MGERRVSGWFVLSAVFVVMVFGLFFTFTERKTWPEHRIELGPMDMRLAPPVSTFWCEAVALRSEHSFVAYQVNRSARINPMRMHSQSVNLQMRLHGSWGSNAVKFKYFLLPSSVVEIIACSSAPVVKLMVFKGDLDVQRCLQNFVYSNYVKSSEYSSESSESSEKEETVSSNYNSYTDIAHTSPDILTHVRECSSLIHYQTIETAYIDEYSTECNPSIESHPVKFNITSADYYVIVVWNTNRQVTNHVNLQVILDRTRYTVHTSGQTLNICALSNSCTIGLDFASGDGVLVSMPEEPNAGRRSFVIRSRCKPRLAVFAFLSVILPFLLFLAASYVVRTDRDSVGRFFCKIRQSSDGRHSSSQRIVTPLLDDHSAGSVESLPRVDRTETAAVQIEDMPPPYHSLYDPPPPYACVKNTGSVSAQTR